MFIVSVYHACRAQTRSVVERGIGHLKCKFHDLHGEVRISPQKTCKIIMACTGLYNLCKEMNLDIPMADELLVQADVLDGINHDRPLHPRQARDGL